MKKNEIDFAKISTELIDGLGETAKSIVTKSTNKMLTEYGKTRSYALEMGIYGLNKYNKDLYIQGGTFFKSDFSGTKNGKKVKIRYCKATALALYGEKATDNGTNGIEFNITAKKDDGGVWRLIVEKYDGDKISEELKDGKAVDFICDFDTVMIDGYFDRDNVYQNFDKDKINEYINGIQVE